MMELEDLEKEIKKISEEMDIIKNRLENIESFLKSFIRLALLKSNSIEKKVVLKVKNDEKAFENFMEFVDKNRRDFLISIIKKKVLERLNEFK
ncbi:MAG: hypothetical protein QW140_00970 [Candidatus Aenigmatarchaeota archaeon]